MAAADSEKRVDMDGKGPDLATAGDATPSDTPSQHGVDKEEEPKYPGPFQLALISVAMGLAIFISGIDNTVVGTATPTITDQFHSITDIGWYGSSYQLTTCATQFLYGKFYEQFRVKWVFVTAVAILELGSIVSAAAPNSAAFIVGRAIAGCGSSGIISGTLIIVAHSVPLRLRPIYNGMVGGIECIGIIIAPLIGGAFTTDVTWRWCFWLNLPIGGFTIAVIVLFFTNPKNQKVSNDPLLTKLKQLNILNLVVFVGSIVCLLLALQWGGTTYSWGSGRIIALLVISFVAFVAFIAIEVGMKERATIPARVVMNRTMALSVLYAFCTASAMNIIDYFLPIWFQAVKNASAAKSGVMLLPAIIGLSISSIGAGFLVSAIGYYTPLMLAGSTMMAIAFGFLTSFTPNTEHPAWIGWQVLLGLGGGLAFSQPFTSAQTALAEADIAVGMSAVVFANTLGGAVFISVAQNIFTNLLGQRLRGIAGINAGVLEQNGATNIQSKVAPAQRASVVSAFNYAVTRTFWIGVAMGCFELIPALFMKWNSVKDEKPAEGEGEGEGNAPDAKDAAPQEVSEEK